MTRSACKRQRIDASIPYFSATNQYKSANQAIDKLEDLLNGGMDAGQSSMFGPREYVQIYT